MKIAPNSLGNRSKSRKAKTTGGRVIASKLHIGPSMRTLVANNT